MTVEDSLKSQLKAELGDQEEHPTPKAHVNQLMQKYGMAAVQLTPEEQHNIIKDGDLHPQPQASH